MLQVLAAGSGQDHALGVGDLGQSLVSPELLTLGAVPVLDVAIVVASRSNSLEVSDSAAGSGQDHALGIGDLSAGLVSPEAIALSAVPVLNVTVVVASGLNSLEVNQLSAGSGQDHALGVGDLSAGLVSPEAFAIGAMPVLNVTVGVAAGLNSVKMYNILSTGGGNNNHLDIGEHGAGLVQPAAAADGALPVLLVAHIVAASLNGIVVGQGVSGDIALSLATLGAGLGSHAGSIGPVVLAHVGSADGDGVTGNGEGNVVVITVEDIVLVNDEVNSQITGGVSVNSALESHQDSLGSTGVAGAGVRAEDEDLAGLGELCLNSVHSSRQAVSLSTGTLNIGQTGGDRQLHLEADDILDSANADGVGDGITRICLSLVSSHRKAGIARCECRYHSSNHADEHNKNQDDGHNSLVHDQAPF